MSELKEKEYYVATHNGEPVLYGGKANLYLKKEDISAVTGDVIEKVRLVRVGEAKDQ